jgi:hypothetical protein
MFWARLALIAFFIAVAALYLYVAEIAIAAIAGLPPKVKSGKRMREAVVRELRGMDFQTVFDAGSGFGGMCGRIARAFPNARVVGAELMPMPFVMSKIAQVAGLIPRRVRFRLADMFSFAERSDGFDVGTFYQLPGMMKRVESEIMGKFKVLMVLDFPLPNARPAKKRELHRDLLGQHWLYVYGG